MSLHTTGEHLAWCDHGSLWMIHKTLHCIGLEEVEAVFRTRRWESCNKNPVVKKSTLGEQLASCCISQCEHESTGQVHESEVCPLYFGDPLI